MNSRSRVVALASAALLVAAAAAMVGLSRPQPLPAPKFVEEAESAGLDHSYQGEFLFFVGGGAAVFDCDGDRQPEVFLAGGENPSALYRNASRTGGALNFVAHPNPVTDLGDVIGAYPLDVDGDGPTDLVLLRVGENVILRGLGDCGFERANQALDFDGGDLYTTAFSAMWEQGGTLPTLAFGNYFGLTPAGTMTGSCSDNELYRPDEVGGGYAQPTALSPSWCTLSMLFSDWDRSGNMDLRVSNDREYSFLGEEQLWQVEPGRSPVLYTEADGWEKMQIFGMGIASQDLDEDGRPEVFLSNQGDNRLLTLDRRSNGPVYTDVAADRGALANTPYAGEIGRPSTAWHPAFEDVNNDSFMDLFISKGNVEAMSDFAARDPSNLLLGQRDGSFVEGAMDAGIVSYAKARGAAVTDFNLDGMLDLLVVNRRQNVSLWRGVGVGTADRPITMGNWLAVSLHQHSPNVDAIGAWVEVDAGGRTISRELTVGGGHAGGQLGWIHFGLGSADRAKVRVQWPDGTRGDWMTVEANRFVDITRGVDHVEYWQPGEG